MKRRTWIAGSITGTAVVLLGVLALTSCTGDAPAPTPSPSPTASPMPATAAETAQQAFALLALRQQSDPTAVTEACRYFTADAYRVGPDPDEFGYENADGGPQPAQDWNNVPMARWCGEDDAEFPEPIGKYELDGQIPAIEDELRQDDGTRWVRVQFEGQTGTDPVEIERVAALAPQDDDTWRIERWCYVPLWDGAGRYTEEFEDPFTCLERTQ
jgi:hypothetical protein